VALENQEAFVEMEDGDVWFVRRKDINMKDLTTELKVSVLIAIQEDHPKSEVKEKMEIYINEYRKNPRPNKSEIEKYMETINSYFNYLYGRK
jgi:hypothetical protein